MAVKLATFNGAILGMGYGDVLVFGTRIQGRKVVLLYGEFALNISRQNIYLLND